MNVVSMTDAGVALKTRCIVVADDLTGACDSGLEFARRGFVTRVSFGQSSAQSAHVVAISLNSRRLSPTDAARCARAAVESMTVSPGVLVFKKIDSTLRGNLIAECDAVRTAVGAPFGVIAPALPSQGRIVSGGVLRVRDIAGSWSVNVREILANQGSDVALIRISGGMNAQQVLQDIEQAGQHSAYVLCDAATEDELALIAEALAASSARPIWIGSAGLAKYAALTLRKETTDVSVKTEMPKDAPVVLCVGTDHPVTKMQIELFHERHAPVVVSAEDATPGQVRDALIGGSHLILMIDTGCPNTHRLRDLLAEARGSGISAVMLTGGDTAEMVCRAVNADDLLLSGDLVSGVATGKIEGGTLDGLTFAAKSGGFGNTECLVESVSRLSRGTTDEDLSA